MSEFNDSAMDSTEDIEDEELKEEKEEPELVKIVGEGGETGDAAKTAEVKPADPPVNIDQSTTPPMICLEVRDSSTESDKTTLSINTVLDHHRGGGTGTDSLPSTPGIVSQASLSLPEIVVEEPRTPPATSPLASPNEGNKSAAMLPSRRSSQEEAVRPSSPKHFMPKASSLPPLSCKCYFTYCV